jgi:alkanesulfonate monooxygenase SsuD/methylene tetrahydromethanopterin reductase-like flavin-dependent oxidoreductase (luciferase family)
MTARTLKLGLSLPNQHPLGADPVAGLHQQLELVRLARDLAWESVWTGQHFLVDDLQMLQPGPYLGRVAAESGDLKLGLGIALSALINPVQLAEDLASLDVISGGRLIAGVGLGYRSEEYAAFGIPESERVKRLVGNLRALESLWGGEDVEIDLPWCQVHGSRASILPVQRPRPPIWMAAHTDAAVVRAARMADAWFVSPHVNRDTLVRQREVYADARRDAGLPPASEMPTSREVFCARTREEAIRVGGPYVLGKYRSYARWGQDKILPEEVSFESGMAELEKGRFVIGSPDECIEQLLPLVTELDVTHLVCRMTWLGMPNEIARSSIERFDAEVRPVLEAAAGQR